MTSDARLSRRRFLRTSVVAAGAGILAPGLVTGRAARALAGPGAHDGPLPTMWSVAAAGGYVALAAVDGAPALVDLEIGAGGQVTAATPRGVTLPGDLLPEVVVPLGGHRLLVAGGSRYLAHRYEPFDGGAVAAPDRDDLPPETLPGAGAREVWSSEPAGVVVDGTDVRPFEAPAREAWAFAQVEAGVVAGGALTLLIQHSVTLEASYGEGLSVAERGDGGWAVKPLATGLGEAWPALLAAAGGAVLAGVTSGDGTVHLRERRPGDARPGAWRPVAPPGGATLGAVAGGAAAQLVAAPDAEGVRRWWRERGVGWREAPPLTLPGDELEDVIAVTGSGELLLVGHTTARLV